MDEWNTIHLLNASPAQLGDPTFVEKCRQAYNAAKSKRSEAIEAALSVEGVLDQVLLDLLVGRDAEKRDQLREFVLMAEFCSAFQKWKMLKQLMLSVPVYFSSLDKTQGSTLRSDVKSLFDDRNKFAHGDLFVEATDYSVSLRYYESGTKWMKVDKPFVQRLLERADKSRASLFGLHSRFGTDITTAILSVPAS